MIYIDAPIWKTSPKGRKTYAHMVGTTKSELDAFAVSIGVKSHFWHAHKTMPHYDITSEQCIIAISHGAVQVSSREIVQLAKDMI